MNGTPTLSFAVLSRFSNEAIFQMIERGLSIDAERVAIARQHAGKWIDAAQANAFRARRAVAGVVVGLSVMSAHAMDAEQTAQAAAAADGASTVAALASGAIESNPLVSAAGLPLVTLAKVALPRLVRDAEPETRKAVLVGASGIYGGAAVNNLLIVAGAGPIAIVGGIVAGIWFAFHTADKFEAEELAKAQEVVRVAEVGHE